MTERRPVQPLLALLLSLALGLSPALSEAKRLGAGKSTGMQRDMPARTAPDAPPPKPVTPTQAAPTTPATPATAPATAAPKRSWMGPLAGLAAGLGLGALLGHLGMGGLGGEGGGGLLLLLLLAGGGFVLFRLLKSRAAPQPVGAGSSPFTPTQVAWPPAAPTLPVRVDPPLALASATAPPSRAFVPAAFDSDGFARSAKTIFVRMQAANDSADLDDLRRFTTPEMFAELRVDLQERGPSPQQTDVVQVDTQVLDVADDGQRQIVSVRFHGLVREETGAAPVPFDEVWHLVKPHDDSRTWAIAGIQQQPAPARP